MNLSHYVKSHFRILIYSTVTLFLVNLILFVSERLTQSLEDILYLDFLLVISGLVFGFWDYFEWKARYSPLEKGLKESSTLDGLIPPDEDFYSRLINDVIKNKNNEMHRNIQDLMSRMIELEDYITLWVHEIKTPISVSELILERMDENKLAGELQTELEKIKFLTNQVLYISRANSYHEDLLIKHLNLGTVIKSSLKKQAVLLIAKNIEIETTSLEYEILSDEKWLSYIFDQILNNASKYAYPDSRILVKGYQDAKNNTHLVIRNSGAGIQPGDLSRIFDKGYSSRIPGDINNSTGMGLYISKKILEKLGHSIEVSSIQNLFTEFHITFFAVSSNEVHLTNL